MSFLQRIFGRPDRRHALDPLYLAIVAAGRDPSWYRTGRVPDTVTGRFDMMAVFMALVLLRLEAFGESGREPAVLLTETFIADMDSSLREIGIGDYVVGKHIGRLMGALGGRLSAFREAGVEEKQIRTALARNLYHDQPVDEEALIWTSERITRFRRALERQPAETILAGQLPGF